jgi:hypothetical protein
MSVRQEEPGITIANNALGEVQRRISFLFLSEGVWGF